MRTYGLRSEVNCSILFTELPVADRARAARKAGFGGVEFWWPWDAMAPSDRGIVSHPQRAAKFRENVAAAVEIASPTSGSSLTSITWRDGGRRG